ncbi:MAG: methylmalonyl-CoA epimerase [Candidatus Kapabacteria bacterium]|nr:methylmalonyl-CoA epimerase [Candidatus Kapabacteria bacterium]
MITQIDHIGIAVRDIDASMQMYSKIFGVESFHREQVPTQGVDVASFELSGVRIELTAALSETSPIATFIAKRGEGIHHVAFRTDAIQADLDRLGADGVRLVHTEPQPGAHDMQIAFMHPSSTGGVLMELCTPKH